MTPHSSYWRQVTQIYLWVDVVFNLIFYFPTWSTAQAKIVRFQPEYIVVVQQSITLSCEAEGNPPPTYNWTPCDPEQVCNKNTLQISHVLNDASYTCRVANLYGDDSKTVNVCKSHVYCSHASNSCIFKHVPTWYFDWFLELNRVLACQVIKAHISAFPFSWWITLCFL